MLVGCTSTSTTFNDLWRFDLERGRWVRPLATGVYHHTVYLVLTRVQFQVMFLIVFSDHVEWKWNMCWLKRIKINCSNTNNKIIIIMALQRGNAVAFQKTMITKWNAVASITHLLLQLQLQLQNYTLQQKRFVLRGVISVSLSKHVGLQLWSELLATVVWWANVIWKCVPDHRSRNGETLLADGRVCPRNEQVTTANRTKWPTWQIRDWADDLLEVDRTGTSDTVEGQSSDLELYPRSDWQPVKSVTKHWCDVLVFANTNDHTSGGIQYHL